MGAQSPHSWLLGFCGAPSAALLIPRLTFPAFPSQQVSSTLGLGSGGGETRNQPQVKTLQPQVAASDSNAIKLRGMQFKLLIFLDFQEKRQVLSSIILIAFL